MNEKFVDLSNYTKEQVVIWCSVFLSKLEVEDLTLDFLSMTLFGLHCTKEVQDKSNNNNCAVWKDNSGRVVFELDCVVAVARILTEKGMKYFLVDDVINRGLLKCC